MLIKKEAEKVLCQFSFKNFKSYKEETTFDLQAADMPEFADSLIIKDKCSSLLPVGVIYGSNGGGKTNFIQALSYLIYTVVKPIHELGNTRKYLIMQQKVIAEPFLFDSVSKDELTEFKIFFRTKEYEYCYYLAVLNDEILTETLDRKLIDGKNPTHIFYREGEEISLGTILEKEKVNTNINIKMPFLSFLAINYNIPVIVEVQEWFESCIVRSYNNPKAEKQIMALDDTEIKKQIIMLLNDMDIDVYDYRFDDKENQLYIKRTIGNMEYEIPFENESEGIRKLIAVLPVVLIALKKGRLVIIDELDTKLHPKLLRYIISMFKNRKINKYGAQLIFTSHDIATMRNTVFRRDEIWFAVLDKNHSSDIYSLYEIKQEDNERVSSTAAFDKQYFEGRYGAVPYLKDISNLV